MSIKNLSLFPASKSHLINSIALIGICVSLTCITIISIIGPAIIPCGVIFLGTPLFQAMMILSVLSVISIFLFISSIIKLHQENKKLSLRNN